MQVSPSSSGAPFLYTERRLLERIRNFADQHGQQARYESLAQRSLLTDDLVDASRAGRPHAVRAQDPAFIQYFLRLDERPKGIVLTHANLLANLEGATRAANFNEQDVALSWMPLTHDMGLIGMHIYQLANRAQMHQMPTELFVRRPALWLQLAPS